MFTLTRNAWIALGAATAVIGGYFYWRHEKNEVHAGPATVPVGSPAPAPSPTPPGLATSLPSVPLALDWHKYGRDIGMAAGAKDKIIGTIQMKPEAPASEVVKASDPIAAAALQAGYIEGYNIGVTSVPAVVAGRWHGNSFMPDYWRSIAG